MRKNCASDREKLLKFEAEGREFAKFLSSRDSNLTRRMSEFEKFLRSLKQFIQTVKGQNNFW